MPRSLIPKKLVSKIVAKDNSVYSQGIIVITGDKLDNLLYYFSFDGKDNLQKVNPILTELNTIASVPITSFPINSLAGISYKFIGLNAKVTKVELQYIK